MVNIINFSTNLSHTFTHTVNGKQYKIHIIYNKYLKTYYMNIDKVTSSGYENIINSIILTMGIDLLQQYQYLNLGKLWLTPIKSKSFANLPNTETLKSDYIFLWEHD